MPTRSLKAIVRTAGIILVETVLLLLLAAWMIPAGRGSSAAAGTAITFEESLGSSGVIETHLGTRESFPAKVDVK